MRLDQKDILSEYLHDEILTNYIRNISTTCIMAMIAIPFFSSFDYLPFREHLKIFLILRTFSKLPFFVVFFLLKKIEIHEKAHLGGECISLSGHRICGGIPPT